MQSPLKSPQKEYGSPIKSSPGYKASPFASQTKGQLSFLNISTKLNGLGGSKTKFIRI